MNKELRVGMMTIKLLYVVNQTKNDSRRCQNNNAHTTVDILNYFEETELRNEVKLMNIWM